MTTKEFNIGWANFVVVSCLIGGTWGVLNWTGKIGASVAFFCFSYLVIVAIVEISKHLIKIEDKLENLLHRPDPK